MQTTQGRGVAEKSKGNIWVEGFWFFLPPPLRRYGSIRAMSSESPVLRDRRRERLLFLDLDMGSQKLAVLLCLMMLYACGIRPGSVKPLVNARPTFITDDMDVDMPGASTDTVIVTYLGCGGLLIGRNGKAILVDPFFSNQKFMRIGRSLIFGSRSIRPDKEAIDKGVTEINRILSENRLTLTTILVAHSHYDHLMDVPAIVRMLPHHPWILVNRTGYNICRAVLDSSRVVILEDHLSRAPQRTSPVAVNGTGIHVYPIPADHNPHFRNIEFFSGEQTVPVDDFKDPLQRTRVNMWLDGNTFSFVVDFLDDTTTVAFRVFIQSTSCNPPAGVPSEEVTRIRKTDIAFLGVVSFHFSPEYPCAQLDQLQPAEIVWVHWEDFFRRYGKSPKTVRGTDIPGFFQLPCVGEYDIPGKLMPPLTTIRLLY